MDSDQSVLVPPRRLGTLLRQARTASGLDIEELAAGSELSVTDLDDLEHGRRTIDDGLLTDLLTLYGVEDAGLVPARSQLVIDLDEGRIAVEDSNLPVGESSGPDAVLARYLALVYRLRDLPLGTPLSLRDLDLDVLSTALAIDSTDVEQRLQRLMADEVVIERDQHRIRRRVLLPLIGVVIAATGVGTLLLVAENAPSPDPVPAQTDTGTARVADPAIVDGAGSIPVVGDPVVVDGLPVDTDIADPAIVDFPNGP